MFAFDIPAAKALGGILVVIGIALTLYGVVRLKALGFFTFMGGPVTIDRITYAILILGVVAAIAGVMVLISKLRKS